MNTKYLNLFKITFNDSFLTKKIKKYKKNYKLDYKLINYNDYILIK